MKSIAQKIIINFGQFMTSIEFNNKYFQMMTTHNYFKLMTKIL